jgi:hypothetical protein
MKVSLTLPEPLALPTATQIKFTKVIIEMGVNQITLEYKFIDATDNEISAPGTSSTTRYWRATGQTYLDIFEFLIRQQDVGVKIGTGLWKLIWAKAKTDILKVAGNDIP